MTQERIIGGRVDLETEDGDKLSIQVKSGTVSFFRDSGVERRKISGRPGEVPEGTIQSLKPVLRPALGLLGVEQDEGYWVDVDLNAPFSVRTACAKLRSGRIDSVKATQLLIKSEPSIMQALAHGNIDESIVDSFVSSVSGSVREGYRNR